MNALQKKTVEQLSVQAGNVDDLIDREKFKADLPVMLHQMEAKVDHFWKEYQKLGHKPEENTKGTSTVTLMQIHDLTQKVKALEI